MTQKKDAVNKGLAAVLGTPVQRKEPAAETPAAKAPKAAKPAKGKASPSSQKAATGASAKAAETTGAKKKPGAAPEGKTKVTYYIDAVVVRKLRHLCVDQERRDSAMVEEAMADLVAKYAKKK